MKHDCILRWYRDTVNDPHWHRHPGEPLNKARPGGGRAVTVTARAQNTPPAASLAVLNLGRAHSESIYGEPRATAAARLCEDGEGSIGHGIGQRASDGHIMVT